MVGKLANRAVIHRPWQLLAARQHVRPLPRHTSRGHGKHSKYVEYPPLS